MGVYFRANGVQKIINSLKNRKEKEARQSEFVLWQCVYDKTNKYH